MGRGSRNARGLSHVSEHEDLAGAEGTTEMRKTGHEISRDKQGGQQKQTRGAGQDGEQETERHVAKWMVVEGGIGSFLASRPSPYLFLD